MKQRFSVFNEVFLTSFNFYLKVFKDFSVFVVLNKKTSFSTESKERH